METKLKPKVDAKYAQQFLAGYGTQITLDQADIMLVLLKKLSKLALEAAIAEVSNQESSLRSNG